MWILQAHSIETDARKEIELTGQREWVIGRSSSADITLDWDPYLSRRHLHLHWDEQSITIDQLGEAKNRLFYRGESVDHCVLTSGEEILVGSSLLRFVNEAADEQQALFYEEISYTTEDLRVRSDVKAERHLQILASLPRLLEHHSTEETLLNVILDMLARGITEADGILVISDESLNAKHRHSPGHSSTIDLERKQPFAQILQHHSRSQLPAPHISQRLWRRSLRHQRGALLHLWDHAISDSSIDPLASEMTFDSRYDWAFCLPFRFMGQEMHGLYVYGHWIPGDTAQRERIDADIRFTNLLVEITSAVMNSRQLDKQRVLLEQFMPKEIARLMLQEPDSSLLEPRECELTVLYCDVQEFTARAEKSNEQLLDFLKQISSELECASQAILKYGGVIGDFHGDAVMGFWGWPIPINQMALLACLAAAEIQQNLEQLRQQEAQVPHGKMRVGIATGHGLAGKIGTADQMKVTAFGTVVNRADRLQELGKQLKRFIIIDEETIQLLKPEQLPAHYQLHSHPEMTAPGIPEPIHCYSLQKTAESSSLSPTEESPH